MNNHKKNTIKKITLLALMSISTTSLIGCSTNNESKTEDSSINLVTNNKQKVNLKNIKLLKGSPLVIEGLEDAPKEQKLLKIKDYNRLQIYSSEVDKLKPNSYDNTVYTSLLLSGYPNSYIRSSDEENEKYYLIKGVDKFKSIFKNDKFVEEDKKYLTEYGDTEYIKGYEAKYSSSEYRSISITGNKISFYAFTEEKKENSLKLLLSMEDKIKEMLENILIEEDAEEVWRFLKEEIYRNNDNPLQNTSVSIDINGDMSFNYEYNGGVDPYGYEDNQNPNKSWAKFSFDVYTSDSTDIPQVNARPQDIKEMFTFSSQGEKGDFNYKFLLPDSFAVNDLDIEYLYELYGKDKSIYKQGKDERCYYPISEKTHSLLVSEVIDTWYPTLYIETVDEDIIKEIMTPIFERMFISHDYELPYFIDALIDEMKKLDDDYDEFTIETGGPNIEVSRSYSGTYSIDITI